MAPAAANSLALSPTRLLDDVSRLYNKIDAELLAGDNGRGLALALFSGLLIGSSFIIKKKGLQLAAINGVRAGEGGYSYLKEPLWWSGMVTMILGELANFTAYAYAPAILVTPLGAGSIIVTAILADLVLKEKMHVCGSFGCVLCVLGSVTVVFFSPPERIIQ
ncbi:magnesium transporter NIPA-domain-containing protein, partial [Pavlovales sp. CCMP2436]